MKVLVLGASGMIGNAIIRVLGMNKDWDVSGTVRHASIRGHFPDDIAGKLITGIDVDDGNLEQVFLKVKPDIVINCIGLTKHLPEASDPLRTIKLNAMFPHLLDSYCEQYTSRLVHISTDCIFSGNRGKYVEEDPSDAKDIYGKSKYLGEVVDTQAITLRTSTIGHEILTSYGLLEWFLLQQDKCNGYSRAIFSGLPSVTLAEVIRDHVIPNEDLSGLYHVAGPSISKYDLLNSIADEYNKKIEIMDDDSFVIDRSLNADKFRDATGYVAPDWPDLLQSMHDYY